MIVASGIQPLMIELCISSLLGNVDLHIMHLPILISGPSLRGNSSRIPTRSYEDDELISPNGRPAHLQPQWSLHTAAVCIELWKSI
jgi:hypothetical protein